MGAVYREFSADDCLLTNKHRQWEHELGFEFPYCELIAGIKEVYVVTNVPKYRSFQYRLLNRAIITNAHLYRWGKIVDNKCSFCGQDKETYSHIFVMCDEVKKLWLALDCCLGEINFNTQTVLWN